MKKEILNTVLAFFISSFFGLISMSYNLSFPANGYLKKILALWILYIFIIEIWYLFGFIFFKIIFKLIDFKINTFILFGLVDFLIRIYDFIKKDKYFFALSDTIVFLPSIMLFLIGIFTIKKSKN